MVKAEDHAGMLFGKRLKTSPYDPLLRELILHPNDFLEFDDTRAQSSIAVRAKKLDLRVSFAHENGKLYVKLEGRTDDQVRTQRRASDRKSVV